MDQDWYERLRLWWEGIEQNLRRKWWLWPISVALEVFWHRVYGAVNEFLDARANRISRATKIAVGYIPTEPLPLAIILSLVIVVGLAVHAYFDTRKVLRTRSGKPLPYTSPPPIPPISGIAQPASGPKLTIRVVDAVAASHLHHIFSQPETFVLLKIRVVNTRQPAVTVKSWNLTLRKPDGSNWFTAYEWRPQGRVAFKRAPQIVGREPDEEAIECQFRDRTSTVPLDVGAAEEGWAVFRIMHPTSCHVFGATFVITATDDLGEESKSVIPPGEWLMPVNLTALS